MNKISCSVFLIFFSFFGSENLASGLSKKERVEIKVLDAITNAERTGNLKELDKCQQGIAQKTHSPTLKPKNRQSCKELMDQIEAARKVCQDKKDREKSGITWGEACAEFGPLPRFNDEADPAERARLRRSVEEHVARSACR